MGTDERFDETIGSWFEETAPQRIPDRVLQTTFERTRKSRRHVGWRGVLERVKVARLVPALGGVAAVVVAASLALTISPLLSGIGGPPSSPEPQSAFEGTWVTIDGDRSTPTMTVSSGIDTVDIVALDDFASVCSGTPSTMTGAGRLESSTVLVIPAPVYTCDDGSEPKALSGPPLSEQLRNLTFVHDPARDILTDNFDAVWRRPTDTGTLWPQTSLAEVRSAQELADAGDPGYTWQVDPQLVAEVEPWGAPIIDRFLREELGWEEFLPTPPKGYLSMGPGGGSYSFGFIRCAPGETNPLYPNDPDVGRCAPTIDAFRYETVSFNVEQLGRRDPSGIWVVTRWDMQSGGSGEPQSTFEHLYPDFDQRQVEQVAPPSDAEVDALLQAFLGARVEGEGAEQYLHVHEADGPPSPAEEVPLLHATTAGTPYERFEIERVQGPVWPTGWIEIKVRLFGTGGTVVEQSFVVVHQEDGRLGLMYGYRFFDGLPTTENGQAVPVTYRFLDGEVTFAAAPPWGDTILDRTFTVLGGVGRGSASQFTMFTIVADPLTFEMGCEAGPVPADAEALAQSIQSNPDVKATAPVAVSVGGIDALQMDVVAAPGARDCGPMVLDDRLSAGQGVPMRLYLLDLPEGMSARILAIAISALESEFELVVEAATPVVDSVEFHAP